MKKKGPTLIALLFKRKKLSIQQVINYSKASVLKKKFGCLAKENIILCFFFIFFFLVQTERFLEKCSIQGTAGLRNVNAQATVS